jgi:hypothetical protein
MPARRAAGVGRRETVGVFIGGAAAARHLPRPQASGGLGKEGANFAGGLPQSHYLLHFVGEDERTS